VNSTDAGLLLVQLPPAMKRDDGGLVWFLGRLPCLRPPSSCGIPSWHEEEVFDLLERHNAAYCVMSGASNAVRNARRLRESWVGDAVVQDHVPTLSVWVPRPA